jgi:hypothetical protein
MILRQYDARSCAKTASGHERRIPSVHDASGLLRFRKDCDRAACQRAMLLLVGAYEDKSMGDNTVRRVHQAA